MSDQKQKKEVKKLTKEQLAKKAKIIFNQAQQANSYFLITEQFLKNNDEYHEEMTYSSAFYIYTYNALIVAVFMELSKVYDNNKDSSNIKELLDEYKEYLSKDPKEALESSNKKIRSHIVKDSEMEFFQEEVKEREMLESSFGPLSIPIEATLTNERFIELYEWRYSKLEVQIKNLRKLRNKVYAHNEEAMLKKTIEEVIAQFPLNRKETRQLIDFAFDFTAETYARIPGEGKLYIPSNIGDWEHTLMMVRLGHKYQDVEIEEQLKRDSEKIDQYFKEREEASSKKTSK